jgi:hypothetical protein
MKRVMPQEHLKQVDRYNGRKGVEGSASIQKAAISKRHRLGNKRKHNDSISESKLIKEKLPSSSFASIGDRINVLIPRNSQNILESIDLTATDGAVIKQFMNNNNGDISLSCDDFETEKNNHDSDSETVTGDESCPSLFEPDDESESDDFSLNTKLKQKTQYGSHVRFVD